MQLEVIRAELTHQTTFRNLFQFYLYDFSRFMGWPVTLGGRFIEDDLEGCWTDGGRDPYLFRQNDEWVGLAIVDHNETSRYTGDSDTINIAEFFVMGAYRRQGIGRAAATNLFERYSGQWEVFQHSQNAEAPMFWRRVIQAYTDGNYREINCSEYDGIVQVFQR